MIKKLILVTAVLLVSACTLHKPTDKLTICEQAKRQALYNETTPGWQATDITPVQQAKLKDTIKNNC